MSSSFLNQQFEIALASWIIQDGNYGDFHVGTDTAFALEFSYESLTKSLLEKKTFEMVDRAKYHVNAELVFSTEDVLVMDFGLRAFREQKPASTFAQRDFISGVIQLGIDPFYYFESLYAQSGMPPLIYEWKIDSILRQTAPFIETKCETGQTILARDETKLGWKSIRRTDAWLDDGGNADYVLVCTLLTRTPRSEIISKHALR